MVVPCGDSAVFTPDPESIKMAKDHIDRSDAVAIGPILQGIARPVNDLSRGCSIDDVYYMIAITATQAIAAKKAQ